MSFGGERAVPREARLLPIPRAFEYFENSLSVFARCTVSSQTWSEGTCAVARSLSPVATTFGTVAKSRLSFDARRGSLRCQNFAGSLGWITRGALRRGQVWEGGRRRDRREWDEMCCVTCLLCQLISFVCRAHGEGQAGLWIAEVLHLGSAAARPGCAALIGWHRRIADVRVKSRGLYASYRSWRPPGRL